MNKIYLYGALDANNQISLDEINIDRQIKLDSITRGGVSAVFIRIPADFPLEHTRKGFIHWILIHQQVVNFLHDLSKKVIPFRVGTTVDNIDKLILLIESNSQLFSRILNSIKDLDEWNIVIGFSNIQQVLLKLGEEPSIQKIKEELQKKKTGNRDDLIKIGKLIQEQLTDLKKQISEQIIAEVKSISASVFVNDLVDENTVLSMAFLANRTGVEKIVNFLNNMPEDPALSAKLVGPMPPHSFYTLEVKIIDAESIRRSLNMLGLSGAPDYQELIKANRQILHRIHPDKGMGYDENLIQSVLKSFNLLNCYYRYKDFSVDELEDFCIVEVVNPEKGC